MPSNDEQPEIYLHGYDLLNRQQFNEIFEIDSEDDDRDWAVEFDSSKSRFARAIGIRDPYSVLARSSTQCYYENTSCDKEIPLIRFPAVELLQATLLMENPTVIRIAPSPGSFLRLWKTSNNLLDAFITKQISADRSTEDGFAELAQRARIHTLNYRFNFDRDACLLIVRRICTKFDVRTENKHQLQERFDSLVVLLDGIVGKLIEHCENVTKTQNSISKVQVLTAANFFTERCELANSIWKEINPENTSLKRLKYLAFQLAEIAQEWVYTFERGSLSDLDIDTLKSLSLSPGDLAGRNFEHFFMDNPVWSKPFVEKPDGSFFTAMPQAAFAFPFRILESLLPKDKGSYELFSAARSDALEELLFETVNEAMPSAEVYRNVVWNDPTDATQYENDVVAVLGNQIFLFEAKSGKIAEAAKRGGKKSLERTLDELFVEPARQSKRLETYLNEFHSKVDLEEKSSGRRVDIDLKRPKALYRFGVTIEGLASLTAGRRFFEGLGLIAPSTPWAPSLSFSELRMVSKHLDSEVSFGHYLSRRFSIEELIDFIGDEQDLLSVYLTNGFCILGQDVKENPLMFVSADNPVRVDKQPRQDRANSNLIGVQLPARWKRVADEVFIGSPTIERHKFDILFALMNQPPPALAHLQKRVSRWRSGAGGGSKTGEHSKYVIGDRQYIVMLNFV